MRQDYGIAPADGQLVPAAGDAEVIWTDLADPTQDDLSALSAEVGMALPSAEDMAEIESSSRIYSQAGAHVLTANVLSASETDAPHLGPVTLVLTPDRLVSLRYHAPRAFEIMAARPWPVTAGGHPALAVALTLLETIVDRLADVLEREGREMDRIAQRIFAHAPGQPGTPDGKLDTLIGQIGRRGETNAMIQDSLANLERVAGFLLQYPVRQAEAPALLDQARTLKRDVQSLAAHAAMLSQRGSFLLDATLGLVNNEQNAIIKFFSVVAVVFLPPTLIASIYGMNFTVMPELAQPWGYPVALGAMMLSAVLPYAFFRWRGWL